MNDFRNLTKGVVLGLQSEIQNYQRNREKLRERSKREKEKNKKEKAKVFGYGKGQTEPTTIEELKQVPAVKKSREGR